MLRAVTPRRLVIWALLATSFAGVVYAFTTSRDEEPLRVRDEAVVRVFPREGDINVRQDAIGVELAFGYTGVIQVDRVEIPEDQLDRIAGINRISYVPGPGKETGPLAPGRHCATTVFWRQSETREQGRTYTWCFTSA